MKNQIIHTLVISAAILGAGFVIGTIVKDKPQAVTEAKPAPQVIHEPKKKPKQTEPVQVVEDEAELIKELVAQNDGLKKIIAEQSLKISKLRDLTDAYRKLQHTLNSEMRVARIHKENFQMMANYATHIRKLRFGYGVVPDIGRRNPKKIKDETEWLVNRIESLKTPVAGPLSLNLNDAKRRTEIKLLVIALEFRLALVQQKLMAHPHPVGGIALRQHKNGRIVPFDGAIKPLLESPPITPMIGIGTAGAGGGAKLDGAKGEPLNNKSNKK